MTNKLAAVLVVCGLAVAGLRADVVEQVLVKVNGEILTKTDLEQLQVTALKATNPNVTAADLQNDATLRKLLNEVTPRVIINAVDEMLLVQRGRELGLKMSDEQFTQILANIRKENKLDSEEKFQAALKQEGLSIAGLRKAFEKQMLINRVQQQDVYSRISISEAESRSYYDAHTAEFLTNETVTLREIFVRAAQTTPAEGTEAIAAAKAAALAKVGTVRERVLKEDFATVAGEISDAASKANGGLIGPLGIDELNPDIKTAIATLKTGQVSEPLDAGNGYRLLKVDARVTRKQATFEEARDQIAEKVFNQRRAGEVLKYLDRLRAQAIIEWKSTSLKEAWDVGRAEAAKAVAEAEAQAVKDAAKTGATQ
ncbi:MAG: peptidyl-prolyl cis-trans isomerase [Acidobacteria bacterium]|nr:peptidyl-prolyl cis-trans isomerase [Acidobacteriota bacterium]